MYEWIVLGVIQGLAEWLPVSSEGMVVLAQIWLFGKDGIGVAIENALWLHLGTLLAAVVYFWKDLVVIVQTPFRWNRAKQEDRNVLVFLGITTVVSGILGLGLLQLVETLEHQIAMAGQTMTALVGILLVLTGWLQITSKAKDVGLRQEKNLEVLDGMGLGLAQGLAALPGFSRSGLTIAALLMRKFDKRVALKLSFLMSIPIVLAGNILLNIGETRFQSEALVGVAVAFAVGLATIHYFMKLAEKVHFGKFVVAMGLLTVLGSLLVG